jgi:hypothetical protein
MWRVSSSGSGGQVLDQIVVDRHQHVDVVHVDEAVAERARHLRGFTWAMTSEAFSAADLTMSTEMPRLQKPLASGGVTWISATSRGRRPLSNRAGCRRGRSACSRPALLDDVAHVLADEEAVDAEGRRHLAGRVGRVAEGEQVDDLHVGELAPRATRARTSRSGWAQPVPMKTRWPGRMRATASSAVAIWSR